MDGELDSKGKRCALPPSSNVGINCLLDVTGGGAIRRGRDCTPATPGGRARGPFRIQGSDDGLVHAPLRQVLVTTHCAHSRRR